LQPCQWRHRLSACVRLTLDILSTFCDVFMVQCAKLRLRKFRHLWFLLFDCFVYCQNATSLKHFPAWALCSWCGRHNHRQTDSVGVIGGEITVLMYGCETRATTKYRCLALMHLTSGHYARSWGYRILATCQMQKSEEPLVVHRSLTWWLIDVCGSSAVLLAVHLARITTEPLQRVSDNYRPTGSDQQEDLATLGSVQLRQTLALWTLASRLPGERPHVVNTAALQRSMLWKKKDSQLPLKPLSRKLER